MTALQVLAQQQQNITTERAMDYAQLVLQELVQIAQHAIQQNAQEVPTATQQQALVKLLTTIKTFA